MSIWLSQKEYEEKLKKTDRVIKKAIAWSVIIGTVSILAIGFTWFLVRMTWVWQGGIP